MLAALNETTFVSGSWDNTIKVWDIHTGECIKTLKSSDEHRINALALINKTILASSSWSNTTIKLWSLELGKCIKTLTTGHFEHVTSLASISGTILASGGSDSTIKLWQLSTFESVLKECAEKNKQKGENILTKTIWYLLSGGALE